MTTLVGRPNTALLVIDVLNGVMAGVHNRDGVIANIAFLVARPEPRMCPSCGCKTPPTPAAIRLPSAVAAEPLRALVVQHRLGRLRDARTLAEHGLALNVDVA
jgi:hypothetical protein